MKNMICVTGAGGSIGHVLVSRLLRNGSRVRAIVRKENDISFLRNIGAEVNVVDFKNRKLVSGLLNGCSMVIHAAGKVLGSDAHEFWKTNVMGTSYLIDEAIRAGVSRFVHISSIAIYGYPTENNVAEDHPWIQNDDPYIKTKQISENIVWENSNRINVTIIRPGEVIGPNQYIWTTRIIDLIKKGWLHVPIDSGYLNPVYIDNLIDALILLGDHPLAIGQAFNVVDGSTVKAGDYIKLLSNIANKKILNVPSSIIRLGALTLGSFSGIYNSDNYLTPSSINYLFHKTSFNNKKIHTLIGWKPVVDFVTSMENINLWHISTLEKQNAKPHNRNNQL